ncbi:hypothetical protein [Bdellovibrio sp. ArHS]|uniref:hypothetical protein n=1 Tax=Bdellovibrio sp. ArHS TaxID=1569284 RepID=UPI0025B9EAD4|nr:hypothetical protein [Bdellovibrio sp. ArHS]
MDKFLSFWDHYNTLIIEGLIALVILLSLFLAYRSFFAKRSKEEGAESHSGLDAAQLEKTLQKILENQQVSGGVSKTSRAASTDDLSTDVDLEAMERTPVSDAGGEAASAESAAEVAQLRASLGESSKKVEALQAQLKEALRAAEAAATAQAPVASGGESGGLSAAEKAELDGKLRDLEARLAEYEIISEDIADLSRYREENENLRKEIEALKAGGATSTAAAPQEEPVPVQPEEAPAEPSVPSEPVAEEPPPVVAVDVAAPEAPAAPAETGSADLIDDELMKEFAAAVEGQKALDKAAEKAGDGSEKAAATGDETDKLMNEFENFVSKKS